MNLVTVVTRAIERIEATPEDGLNAPGPYPELAQDGRRWIKEGRYWFRYSVTMPPVIVAVFFETADLPGRA